jgi:hypothetical protein
MEAKIRRVENRSVGAAASTLKAWYKVGRKCTRVIEGANDGFLSVP